jgi:hypothetical protein
VIHDFLGVRVTWLDSWTWAGEQAQPRSNFDVAQCKYGVVVRVSC